MRSTLWIGASLLALAGCVTAPPASNSGVGFEDYSRFELERARRDAALQAQTENQGEGAITTSELQQAGIGQGQAIVPPGQGIIQEVPGSATPIDLNNPGAIPQVATNNPGISDENDFDAVASRESIESDAQRRAAQAAARQQILPQALPTRSGDGGPNIVDYALSTSHGLGQQVHTRSALTTQSRFQRNCAKYRTADEAQRDFLARGGPSRDRLGIDPDGDGFACGWNPTPYRAARNAAPATVAPETPTTGGLAPATPLTTTPLDSADG